MKWYSQGICIPQTLIISYNRVVNAVAEKYPSKNTIPDDMKWNDVI